MSQPTRPVDDAPVHVPAADRPGIEPFLDQIVDGIHEAFSIAIANPLWLGLVGALASTVIIALFVPELTLRHTPAAAPARAGKAPRPEQSS